MNTRKRKHGSNHDSRRHRPRTSEVSEHEETSFSSRHDILGDGRNNDATGYMRDQIHVQAYEADLVRGPQAWERARALEASTHDAAAPVVGNGLIELGGEGSGVWVDRYDARLLLDSTSSTHPYATSAGQVATSPTPSASGWSDLPSDTEDMFFLSAEEIEDFQRAKRKRKMDADRAARLRALEDEDDTPAPTRPEDSWGGSDEEPDEYQATLMRRTATHLASSDNRAQLEMRILANHGADPRMAFLRGRWAQTWKRMVGEAEREKREREKPKPDLGGLAGLAGYTEDSDDEDEEENEDTQRKPESQGRAEKSEDEAAKIERRRALMREWTAKRRVDATASQLDST